MNTALPRSIVFAAGTAVATLAQAGPTPEPLDFDPTFAGDGRLILEPGTRAQARAGVIDDTGEILLFGQSDDGSASAREAIFQRIFADGTPGALERFDAQWPGCQVPRSFLTGIRLSNGDYLGAGYVQEGCSGRPRLFNALQLAPSGGLVEEFDRVPFDNQRAYIRALGEQSDGSIIAVGFTEGPALGNEAFDVSVARFTPAGVLDPTFGSGGTFTFDRAGDEDQAFDVVVDPADRILVAGRSRLSQGDQDMLVLRLEPDGALDSTFDGDGVWTYDGGGGLDEFAASIDLAGGGRILIGGTAFKAVDRREATIVALTENGALDTGFGNGGLVSLALGNTESSINDILYDAWRIYVAGWSRPVGGQRTDIDAAVTVLRSTGAPNTMFNGGEAIVFAFDPALGPQFDLIQTVDVSGDGQQILVTGYTENEALDRNRIAVVRLVGRENALFIDGFEGGGP
ncbi:hypothetical protein [Halomonas denitrificans]|nr:hypothetical protein [Halomonas denitrificans]